MTHPDYPTQGVPVDEQRELAAARRRARALLRADPHGQGLVGGDLRGDPRDRAPSSNVLSTDLGQVDEPAGRGRARADGRPPARGGLHRGRGPHDGRRQHEEARRCLDDAARRQRALGRLRLARRGRDRDRRRGRRRRRTSSRSPTASAASRASSGRSPARPRSGSRRSATARRRRPRPRSARTSAASTSATTRSCMDAAAVDRLTDLIRELEPHADPHPRRARPVQPRSRRRARRDRAGAAAGERRRRRERVQDDRAARAADLRAAPARAVRVRADDVPRHHARVEQEGGGDGGDGRAGLPPAVLLRARRAPGQPRAAHLGPQRTSATPRRSSARSPSWSTRCDRLRRPSRGSASRRCTRPPAASAIVDLPLTQVVPGSRVAGPARIALCAPGDNTMVHARDRAREPGRRPRADERRARAGRARSASCWRRRRRRAASRASSSTAPCATSTSSRRWACRSGRGSCARRARRRARSGSSTCRSSIGGAEIRPGRSRRDGLRRSDGAPARAGRRGAAARARAGAARGAMRQRYAAGELSYDLQGAARDRRGLMEVAVLGLGEAGGRIAADLVAAGCAVRGWDPARRPEGIAERRERPRGGQRRRRRAQHQRGGGRARCGGAASPASSARTRSTPT